MVHHQHEYKGYEGYLCILKTPNTIDKIQFLALKLRKTTYPSVTLSFLYLEHARYEEHVDYRSHAEQGFD